MKRNIRGSCASILSGVLYGLIPFSILTLTKDGRMSSSFILMMRMFFASLLLSPFALRRENRSRISGKMIRDILIAGLLLTITSILIYSSYRFIPSGIGISIHYSYPFLCTLANGIFFGVKPHRACAAAALLSFLGIFALCDPSGLGDGAASGILLALLSAFTFAAYLIWLERRGLHAVNPAAYTSIMSCFSGLYLLFYNCAVGSMPVHMTGADMAAFCAVGALAAFAILTQVYGVKLVGAVCAAIFGTLEPIVCAVCGVFFLNEVLTAKAVFGIILVLSAVIIVTLCGIRGNCDQQ